MVTFTNPLRWPEGWPRTPEAARVWGNFGRQLTVYRAHKSLTEELRKAGAANVVIVSEMRLTSHGDPFSEQKSSIDPGVAIYFTMHGNELVMARDGFNSVEKNLRSLALAIEHMRGLERHGGAHMMQRAFAGFTALPPPDGGAPQEKPINWREELGLKDLPDLPAKFLLPIVEQAYRDLAKQYHSDHGGDGTKMIRLNSAIAMARKELKQ